MHKDVAKYNQSQKGEDKKICEMLAEAIDAAREGGRGAVHGGPRSESQGPEAVAQKGPGNPVGLQEHREA